MKIALLAIGFLMILATILPVIRLPYWWIRGFDFPRIQVASLCVLIASVFGVYFAGSVLDYLFIGLLGIAAVTQLFHLVPFCRLYPVQTKRALDVPDGSCVSIVTANVLMPNRRAEDLIKIIRAEDPDIVLTLESDSWWEEALQSLEDDYRYTVKCPLDNLYGMHLYSKLPLSNAEIRYIIEEDIPSIHTQITLPSGDRFALHCLHPAPPSPSENEESTERDAELLVVGKEIAEQKNPSIVVGDLNDVAWSDTTLLFRKISGLLDPRIGRGIFCTFHAKHWFFRWPLDHIFHAEEFALVTMKRLPYFGSDHFSIYAKLSYSSEHKKNNETPSANAEDRSLADEKIKEAE